MTSDLEGRPYVADMNKPAKRRFLHPLSFFRSLPLWSKLLTTLVFLVVAAGIGFAVYRATRPAPVNEQEIIDRAVQQSNAEYEARVKLQAEAPTPEQQYADLQKKAADLKEPDNSQASLQTYVDAAFAGARLNSPESREYAAKALALYPTDPSIRAMFSGQISRLELIAGGDYAAAKDL